MQKKSKVLPKGVKLDKEGYPYRVDDGMSFRVSRCCFAPTSVDENGTFYCKRCYKQTPAQIELEPVR